MADFQNTAQGLAALGRGGDSTLVHMNPKEVVGLQNLAARNGTSLTVNPNTGMPEAFNLGSLLPMVAGVGLASVGMDPMMAGLLLGGATAVIEGDIGAGLGAGLGAYGGASLGKSLNLLGAESVPIGSTTGEIVTDQIQQNLSNMNPTIAGPSGPSMTGFSSTAGSGTMGINSGLNTNAINTNYPQGSEFQGTNVGSIPRNVTPNLTGTNPGYPQGAGFQSPPANKPTIYRNYTQSGGVTASPPVNNLPVTPNSAYPQGAGFQATADTATKYNMPGSGVPGDSVYGQVSEDGLTGLANRAGNRVSNMGKGLDTLVNDYDRAREILGTQSEQVPVFNPDGSVQSYTMSKAVPLDNIDMAMKFGLPIAGGIAGGLEASDFQPDPIDMAQFEDRRYRGPDGQLNLSESGTLNLNNPYNYTAGGYGYAEGGEVERNQRARQGMRDALARNKGTAYAQPTTNVASNVGASNINVGGFRGGPSNLKGGVGSLNVNSGTIGQSPNAIAAAAAAAADRKANFKIMPNGQEVPIDFNPGGFQGVMGGMQNAPQSHYRDSSGNWHKGQKPGTFQIGGNNGIGNQFSWLTGANYYAEGGEVKEYAQGGMTSVGYLKGPGDGMSDSLAAQIDESQPAALSQGEFVVPADVVSHLGNGSSDAGSKRLYAMMDEVRQARTGTEKQGKEINPERYMPA